MEFPKKLMKASELRGLGFSEAYITELSKLKNQDFCWKMSPTKSNSPILFDTERLQRYLDKQTRILSQASRMI